MNKIYDFNQVISRQHTHSLKYDFASERNHPQDALPLWVADMDFPVADEIKEVLQTTVNHGIYGYSESKGDYYQAVSNWYQHHFDYHIDSSWIIKTPGVVFALAHAIKALTQEGDAVLIQPPVYYPFKEVVEDNHRQLITNSLVLKDGKYHIDFEDFENKIKQHHVKLFLLCSPHNPVGRVWTKEELEKIGQICLENHVYIVSDEIHSDFVYPHNHHYMLASLSPALQEMTITCTAPTKTFNLAGLQISNIIIPNEIIRNKFKHQIDASGYSQCNMFGLVACQVAYEKGNSWLKQVKDYLYQNILYVDQFLKENLPQVHLIFPEGTYLLWLDFRELHLSNEQLDDLIVNKAKLWLDSGSMFGKDGEGFQRINVACPRSILKQALFQLQSAINQ